MFKATRNKIRFFRWVVKAVFLVLFIMPIAYLGNTQIVLVKSFFSNELFALPIVESPDSFWFSYYGDVKPGLWILCPFGGLQVLLTRYVEPQLLIPTIIALLIPTFLTLLFGNIFCSWICPIGTLIDCFDKFIEKYLPSIETKRSYRTSRRVVLNHYSEKPKACKSCLFKAFLEKNTFFQKSGLPLTFVFSFLLKFPVFCVICPVGIISRGMIHLKSIKTVLATRGTQLILWIEMLIIPLIALLLSLKERRYWCKYLCPLGFFLGLIGSKSPLIKPRVNERKCVMKNCPGTCVDYDKSYCLLCRVWDCWKCERICPMNVRLVDEKSLYRCIKCLECYIACEYDAIHVKIA